MRFTYSLLIALLTLTMVPACAEEPASATQAPALESEEQKVLYALGLAISQRLAGFDLSQADLAIVQEGLSDGVLGHEPKVNLETFGPKIDQLAQTRNAARATREKEAGQAYRDTAAQEPGAETTESGLVFIEITPGTGDLPQATDTVRLHYHGTLQDGTVFDSSVERNQPADFPLNGVVPCFREGLQKVKVGGKAKLICPPEIAYGDRGAPPRIPPGATLTFEVELLEILPAATPPTPES